jgi:hypothetical protein
VLGLASLRARVDDNQEMRRGLVLTGLWVVGVMASVALAFGAVGNVASQVAPPGVARLSARGVDRALGTTVVLPSSTTAGRPAGSSAPPVSGRGSTTTVKRPGPGSSSTAAPPPSTSGGPGTSAPTSSATSPPPTTGSPPPTGTPPTTALHSTATTSVGGTVWTRCSGAEHITFVAAVPRAGYERTRDVENASGIVQWFDDGSHISKISAECSNGVVHAEVEEESGGGSDYAPAPTDSEPNA